MGRHGQLIKNTIMLYLLTFSNYFFNFITVPFQTRVLGPEIYGKLGYITAVVTYFQLFMEFGFLLSATEEVAQNKNDKAALRKIFTEVTCSKLLLIVLALAVLVAVSVSFDNLSSDMPVVLLTFWSYALAALIPDFLYRGMEQMKYITVRTVAVRATFALMIFAFLRKPDQYYFVPLFTMTANLIALAIALYNVKKEYDIGFIKVNIRDIAQCLKSSSMFFLSRIATTVYTSTNAVIIGSVFGSTSLMMGYYSSADKLINTGKQALTPIVDSFYPHMVINKDYKFLKKALMVLIPILAIGIILMDILAKPVCGIILGEEYIPASRYLIYMSPIILISFLVMIFGFPTLSPLGLSKYVNMSNIFSAVVHIMLLLILWSLGKLTVENICIATCCTEMSTLVFRLIVLWRHKKWRKQQTIKL